ncbi:MAG TPA: hypothetical protein VHW92_05255 [Mycobacteriales bacterium]|nr:hypothetical protein [Mycobacteriales bacterium]
MSRPPVAPPGWPDAVRPPGAPDWERTAIGWLFDLCPPDFRGYDVLRRYPVVLAHLAGSCVTGAVIATEQGIRTVRHDLREVVPPETVDEAVATYERERLRLQACARSVDLVARAMRGERWAARL